MIKYRTRKCSKIKNVHLSNIFTEYLAESNVVDFVHMFEDQPQNKIQLLRIEPKVYNNVHLKTN